ncbi:MAG: Gfo/Idh/MocA family oxidoreductase [Bryobacterales bacterium]|nr:Gfo/Idh/MocA family oxidoreductase [Bryobacterales bacterium]
MKEFILPLLPVLPGRKRGIGIVGAGSIVRSAHLPAYRNAGFKVEAIFDRDPARATEAAAEFGIPRVHVRLDDLLANRMVDVVDIAVPPQYQPEIAQRAIDARKHLLCQKPLALSLTAAEEILAAAASAGVKLAVNVNMRWDPAMRGVRLLLDEGRIGELKCARFDIRYYENWRFWPWLRHSPRLVTLFDTIHILDLTRTFFGEPAVVSTTATRSDAELAGETAACIQMQYANGAAVAIDTDSTTPAEQTRARFHFSGPKGRLSGTLGIYYDYPVGRPDTLEIAPGEVVTFSERWIPDAFIATMHELLRAIDERVEPQNSGEDHLKTLQLIERVYRSIGKTK